MVVSAIVQLHRHFIVDSSGPSANGVVEHDRIVFQKLDVVSVFIEIPPFIPFVGLDLIDPSWTERRVLFLTNFNLLTFSLHKLNKPIQNFM